MPRGQNTNYAADLGQAVCANLVQERLRMSDGHDIDEETGCWLWRGRVLPDGYAQIKRKTPAQIAERLTGSANRNVGKNFLFHRIAFVSRHGIDVVHTASHLCSRPRCFNPDHIVDEDIRDNNRRKGCAGAVRCPEHGHLIVNLCAHLPPCIVPFRDDIRCCLTLQVEQDAADAETAEALPSEAPASSPPQGSSDPASSSPGHRAKRRRLDSEPISESSALGRTRASNVAHVRNFLAIQSSSLPGSERLSQNSADNFEEDV